MRYATLLIITCLIASPTTTAAAVSCAGECKTIEYRVDREYTTADVDLKRLSGGYEYEWSEWRDYVPPGDPEVVERRRGRGTFAERAIIDRLKTAMRVEANARRAMVEERYEEITRDQGSTNTCSTGCECAEGSFVEAEDNLFSMYEDRYDHSIEVNGRRLVGYEVVIRATATLEWTKRTKLVGCIALEP